MTREPDRSFFRSVFDSRYYIRRLLAQSVQDVADKYLTSISNAGIAVDFGCGAQPYRPIFDKLNIKYIGVDIPGNKLADFFADGQGKTSLGDKIADVVLSTQVLEHADDPASYLAECGRILKPGGLLILSTHGYWKYHPDPRDLWRWTGEGLRQLVADANFEVIDCRALMGLGASGLHLFQDGVITSLPSPLAALMTPFFQLCIMAADFLFTPSPNNNDASIYLMVGKIK